MKEREMEEERKKKKRRRYGTRGRNKAGFEAICSAHAFAKGWVSQT